MNRRVIVRRNYRRGSRLCRLLLKGVRPADLPVDQASPFERVINLKAAKGLDIRVRPLIE